MADVTLAVYEPDLVTLVGLLDQPYGIEWLSEWGAPGAGQFTIPHDAPALVAAPELIAPGSLVVVNLDGTGVHGWMIERRRRKRGDTWDPIVVTGRGLLSVCDSAVTYPFGGLAAPPTDTRLFAWMGHDYVRQAGWGSPSSLGPYRNPTDPSLAPDPGNPTTNEVQRIRLSYTGPSATLSDKWRLNFDGRWTAPINAGQSDNTMRGNIKTALEALPNIDGVTVTGTDPWDIEFTGANVAGRALPLMKMDHSDLRHTHYDWHVKRITSGQEAVEGAELIEGWPDADAEWLGAFGQRNHYTRILDVTARPSAAGPVRLFVVALDAYDVWFDGEHLGSGEAYDVSTWDLTLSEFPHKLAFRADGPIMASVARMNGDEPESVIYRTFTQAVYGGDGAPDPWYAFGPDDPHGVTDGYLLGVLFDDGQARGALAPLSRDWTDTADSNGVAWDDDLELGLAVGDDSLFDAGQRLGDRDVYLRLGPDLILHAYRDLNADRIATVTVPLTAAHDLGAETDDDRRDAFLVRYEDGWLDRHDPAGGMRRESFLSLGTVPTPALAWSLAGRLLDRFLRSALVTPFTTDDAQAPPVPLPHTDYEPGDRITGPVLSGTDPITGDWTLGPVQVDAVGGKVGDTGDVAWVTEVTPP